MRPGCGIGEDQMKGWLCRQDGEIRERIVRPGGAGGFEDTGADLLGAEGLADSAELLAPFPLTGCIPITCARLVIAALGENERYAGEMTRCNALLGEFAAWLRRIPPPPGPQVIW